MFARCLKALFVGCLAVEAQQNGTCSLIRRLEATGFWGSLRGALKRAEKPVVMMLTNAAHYKLVQNYLCGVEEGMPWILRHVIVWCADEVAATRLATDFPDVIQISVDLGDDDATRDAPFGGSRYGAFAAIKAMMPYAATMLGVPSLTQDSDIVWRKDVLQYLQSLDVDAAVMADSNRVDIKQRPCKRKEMPLITAYDPLGRSCSAYRCIASVNGGFIYVAARRSSIFVAALEAWVQQCPAIIASNENQPSFVAALTHVIPPGDCAYNKTTQRKTTLTVLDTTQFASGQRPILARQADERGELRAFHCNFNFGWRAKCETLKKMNMLYINSSTTNVCRDDDTRSQCRRRRRLVLL